MMALSSDDVSTVTGSGDDHNRQSSVTADATGTADHARLTSAIDLGADIEEVVLT